MKKLIYYRPNQSDAEFLTLSQWKKLVKVWGTKEKPYNHMELFEIDHNYNTGIFEVVQILSTIQCDEKLNERFENLKERIAKGFTDSKTVYRGGAKTVEAGIACQIILDAIDKFNKHAEEKIESFKFPFREIYRLMGISYKSIMDKVREEEEKIGEVSKPKKIHKVNYHYPVSQAGDQQSTYKYYYIKGSIDEYQMEKNSIYKKFPYLGKIYEIYREGYFQLYVYDYAQRDWSMQNVIDYLVKNKLVTLK